MTEAATEATTETPAVEQAPPADWLSTLDADGKTYAEAKGFKAPADALAALRGYEPPESADKYELPVPEGDTGEFAKTIAPVLHKAGLSNAQAKTLAEGWNALQATQAQAATEAAAAAEREAIALASRQEAELRREWGETFTAKSEMAKRAAMSFTPGVDEASKMKFLTAMERQFGFDGMYKFWASVGDHMAEAKAHGLGGGGGAPPNAQGFYSNSKMNP